MIANFAEQHKQPVKSQSLSRDEMNLAEFPLAVLSSRANPKVKTLEFSDSQRLKTGEVVERKWIITGADKFGLPTSTDDDVVLGLMRMTMDQGFRERKVYFTRYELLKALRWSTEGRSYKRLVKSLDRLSGVRIRATNAFYDNSAKGYQTSNFGIIDAYEINDERGGKESSRGEQPRSYFIWSEVLFDSFKSGFIKKLDLELYFALRSAVSRRLYRYLDKHFYYKSTLEKNLMTLAFEKLGLSRSYKYVSSIRQQLEPACEELVRVGFLSHFEFSGRGEDAVVRFFAKGQGTAPRLSAQAPSPTPTTNAPNGFDSKVSSESPNSDLVEALISRGIHLAQAKRLAKGRSVNEHKQIEGILRYYDHLVDTRDKKISRNPVGFLYRAVEKPFQFTVPTNFLAPAIDTAGSSARNPRRRPELQLFRADKSQSSDVDKRQQYERFVEEQISGCSSELGAKGIVEIQQAVDAKMACLKAVLSEQRYEQARDGCVREEISRRLSIPTFEAWIASRR